MYCVRFSSTSDKTNNNWTNKHNITDMNIVFSRWSKLLKYTLKSIENRHYSEKYNILYTRQRRGIGRPQPQRCSKWLLVYFIQKLADFDDFFEQIFKL